MFTNRCIELIKKYEGFSPKPYICPAGYVTIGYGTNLGPAHDFPKYKNKTITKQEAEKELFKKVLFDFFTIKPYVKTYMHPYMWDAVLSLVYNIGIFAFKASTLLRKINAKEFIEASNQFLRWKYAGGKVLKGLIRRRQEERKLFLEGVKCLTQ